MTCSSNLEGVCLHTLSFLARTLSVSNLLGPCIDRRSSILSSQSARVSGGQFHSPNSRGTAPARARTLKAAGYTAGCHPTPRPRQAYF
jgi:hypothetical protein